MRDTAEALLRRIQSGADGFLACTEVVFAGKRIQEPGRDELADDLRTKVNIEFYSDPADGVFKALRD